jgi:ATP-dependent Lon protease
VPTRGARQEDQGRRHEQGRHGQGQAELKKLKLMSPMSAEATVVRNFIETLIGLPWRKLTVCVYLSSINIDESINHTQSTSNLLL